MAELSKGKNIKLHIEFLRFIFIFGIVYLHLYPLTSSDERWVICGNYAVNYVAKLAVPVFFMITGALLIPKEEDFKSFLSRRVTRAIGFIVVFFAIQVIFLICKGYQFSPFTLSVSFVHFIFNDYNLSPTNWFIYTYFSLIVLLPFIRILAKSIPNRLYLYLFLIHFVFCAAVPAIFTLLFHTKGVFYSSGCTNDTPAPYSTLYGVFYMLLGHFLENRCQLNKRLLIILAMASAITLAVVCALQMTYNVGSNGKLINLFGFQPIIIACFYITAKRFFTCYHIPALLSRMIILLGSAAFTIMLTENIFRELLLRHLNITCLESEINFVLRIKLCLTTCLGGFLLGLIMKRIPILKKFI